MNVLVKRPVKRRHYVDPFDQIWRSYDQKATSRNNQTNITKPAVNILDKPDQFEIQMAIPGFIREDFKIKVEDNLLLIQLEMNHAEKDENFIKKEFAFNAFERKFEMGDTVQQDQIKAEYLNGILKITLPKKEEAKPPVPRKIEIS